MNQAPQQLSQSYEFRDSRGSFRVTNWASWWLMIDELIEDAKDWTKEAEI